MFIGNFEDSPISESFDGVGIDDFRTRFGQDFAASNGIFGAIEQFFHEIGFSPSRRLMVGDVIEDEAVAFGVVGDAMSQHGEIALVFGHDLDGILGDVDPGAIFEAIERLFVAIFDVIIGEFDGKECGDIAKSRLDGVDRFRFVDRDGASQIDVVDNRIEQDVFIEHHLQAARVGDDDIGREFVAAAFNRAIVFEEFERFDDRLIERLDEGLCFDMRSRGRLRGIAACTALLLRVHFAQTGAACR